MAVGASVELRSLRKDYGSVVALATLSLAIKEGEFVTLLGPSGSGKTTTLMMVAGFEAPTAGSILIKLMWDAVRLEMDPTIAAASSLLIGIAVFLVGTMEVLRRQAAIRVPVS